MVGGGGNNLVKCVLCCEKLFCDCISKYITLVDAVEITDIRSDAPNLYIILQYISSYITF